MKPDRDQTLDYVLNEPHKAAEELRALRERVALLEKVAGVVAKPIPVEEER